ncbi:hypothetical protein [Brevundimonas sp. A19_0]|uniref:hypothetical protein n=1 Tax=Brevundimonas sp. A19_0 TaxID=2821087 RepID=UPI001AD98141|nr:hypothetical protein [Brevundimonas sp. A19_0]MBO9500423.1 hypothetical protein [Brevundimonas sp. A19_0]
MAPIVALFTILALTLAAVVALAARGRLAERWAAVAIAITTLAPLPLQHLEYANGRWALALVSVAFSAGLVFLSLRFDRWWLLVAAGIQLAATASYAVAWLQPDLMLWSGVAFRRVLWGQLMIVALIGAFEPYEIQDPNRRPPLGRTQSQP